jgi:dTDP-glucose pyrophosphorylase/CBS domain-containing protein
MYSVADIAKICIDSNASMRQAMNLMNSNRLGVVLVVGEKRMLTGIISDGDVRRSLLADMHLEMPIVTILEGKAGSKSEQPITAHSGLPYSKYLEIMTKHSVSFLPLLDGSEHVVGLITMEDILAQGEGIIGQRAPMQAVIMAGGKGMRLRPLTEDVPKPMLSVGKRPLLELIIEQLRSAGIHQVNITTHYKPEKITEYFGDGREFGVKLNYVSEDEPLGTAGALSLIEMSQEPLLVINGDILTGVDFQAIRTYHEEHGADMTVAVRKYDLQVPYGVVECDGPDISSLSEKPTMSFFVNAGIYLLQPNISNFIPNDEHLDMNELIEKLLAAERRVVSFPILEYWLDIGQLGDYERAQKDIEDGKLFI